MKKALALILTMVMTITLLPFSAFGYDGTIKAIEFTPNKPLSAYFESDGYFDVDEDEQEYYNYNYLSYGTGDELVIVDNDDNRYTYTAEWDENDGEYYLVSEDGNDRIKYSGEDSEIERIDEQDHVGQHLKLGENNNTFFIEYKGIRVAVPVYIESNPVNSFEYIPASPYEVIENTNGHWDYDDKYGDFFNYDTPSFKEGDVISVTFAGETDPVDYTYRDVDGSIDFYNENDELIPYGDTISHWKHVAPWTVDGANEFFIEYSGISVPVSISVIENTVTGIDYVRAKADEYIDGDTRFDPWDDTYTYGHPDFYEGDVLTVYEGEKTTEYTCKTNSETGNYYFESNDGKTIETVGENCVSFYDSQRETPWVVGDKNEFYVEYMGQTKTLYATVKENPVKSISYVCATPIELYENTEGFEDDGYYNYWYSTSREGDVLNVTDNNNVTTAYTAVLNRETYEIEYIAENGDIIEEKELYFRDNQAEKHWVIGNENEYYVSYMGKQYTLYATIKVNPVKAIEYTRVQPAVLYDTDSWDTGDGNLMFDEPHFLYGDTLVVTYTDNSKKAFTYGHSETLDYDAFVAEDGEAIDEARRYSDQRNTPWSVGGDNEYYIEYMGKKSQPLKVTIKENDIKAIRIEKVNPATVFEGTQHETNSWNTGQTYMAYDIPRFEEGDKLILIDKNDREKAYTYQQQGEEGQFKCGDETLDDMLNVYHYQFMNPWEPDGEYNYFYADLRGIICQVPVTVIASGINSISFTMSKPEQLVFNENEDGEWKTENGKRYFAYTWQNKDFIGSELTLTYKDNSTDVYTVKWNNETNEAYFENGSGDILTTNDVSLWDEQEQNAWTPASQGRLLMRCKGAICEIPVVIRHTYQKNVVPPTCTEKGHTEYTCSACGDSYIENYTDALGHKWDGGKVTKAPSYTAAGVKTYTCSVCGETKTEAVPKLKKLSNTVKVKAKAINAKSKKNTSVKKAKAFSISKAQGKITFKQVTKNKKIVVSKTGKVTVKKGLKKGKIYKIKVKVTAAGNSKYMAKTVTVILKIKIK